MSFNYTIDAQGRTLGRVASEAAMTLLGKKTPAFKPEKVEAMKVTVLNAGKLRIPPKKLSQKKYLRYTGYPGGLRERSMAAVIEKKGIGEIVREAVSGMLPKNKLRYRRLKNLSVSV